MRRRFSHAALCAFRRARNHVQPSLHSAIGFLVPLHLPCIYYGYSGAPRLEMVPFHSSTSHVPRRTLRTACVKTTTTSPFITADPVIPHVPRSSLFPRFPRFPFVFFFASLHALIDPKWPVLVETRSLLLSFVAIHHDHRSSHAQ